MLSRLQQGITLGLLLAAGAWVALFSLAGWPHLAWVGALLIIFGYALFLGLEFAFLRVVNRNDPAPQANAKQLLRAWWGEVLTASRVFLLAPAFPLASDPGLAAPGLRRHAMGEVSFCLYTASSATRGFWNPWLRTFRSRNVPLRGADARTAICFDRSVRRYPRSRRSTPPRGDRLSAGRCRPQHGWTRGTRVARRR